MSFCTIHGRYPEYEDGCPYCKDAEERSAEALADISDRLQELSNESRRSPDFGDYECPHCKYRSLRRNAARCPLCHGSIGQPYWTAVAAAEVERRRLAALAAAEAQRREQELSAARAREAAAAPQPQQPPRHAGGAIGIAVVVVVILLVVAIASSKQGRDQARLSPVSPALCAQPPEQSDVVAVAEDTSVGTVYIQEGAPRSAELRYGGWGDAYFAYLRFDAMPAPPLEEAILCLFTDKAPPNDPLLRLKAVARNWSADEVTINSRPPDLDPALQLPALVSGWNAIDVTRIVRQWAAAPNRNFGIVLEPGFTTESNGHFSSAESASYPPKIVVIYGAGKV